MDTALKHRLTGAILLVVLAVLLLPELLTGAGNAPREVGETGGSADVPVRRYDIDLTERAQAPADTPADIAAPPPGETLPPLAETAPMPVEPAPAGSPSAQATAPKAAPKSPAQRASPPPEPATEQVIADPTPVPAKNPVPSADSAAGRYLVQVGVFSSREGAERIAKTLRGKGFKVTVSRYDTGKRLYRVRVGPVADRAEARRLRERLAAAGHPGSVVAEGVESRSP